MSEEVVKPVDLDAIIARRPRNRVARMGIELEGGWESKFGPFPAKIVRDGSVFKKLDEGGFSRKGYPEAAFGELAIGPMQPAQVARSVTKNYPNLIDASCGLHVHMSFETVLHYAILADSPAYQETMIEYLDRWAKENKLDKKHPIWDRLAGKSVYCQKKFWPEAQMQANAKDHDLERYGHRYTMMHYCWSRFKTVECRILPMMATTELAISAIQRVRLVTNAYLVRAERVRAKAEGKIPKFGTSTNISLEFRKGQIYEEWEEQ